MYNVESISYSIEQGQRAFVIEVFNDETQHSLVINPPAGRYDKSTIINELIRTKYTQDMVEAIINNHFINISEWIDKKFAGSNEDFVDPEYEELQAWRAESKRLAADIETYINNL
jgi:hypothetical protein